MNFDESINRNEKGFTLLELSTAMIILALIVVFATVAFSGLLGRNFEQKTFNNMEVIADSLAIYAQRHMRLPCPADPTGVVNGTATGGEPFGTERGSFSATAGENGSIFGACNANEGESVGIIPFATLGLPRSMVKDRFGNFITYRVAITSSLTPAVAETLPINSWCMTRPYWHKDTDFDGTTDDYVNLAKAAFCCGTWQPGGGFDAGVGGDIVIDDVFGNTLPELSRQVDDGSRGVGSRITEYRRESLDPPSYNVLRNGGAGLTTTEPPLFPAYILVSHGRNGYGAYNGQTGVRQPASNNVFERENSDDNREFVASNRISPVSPSGAENFDDIVFWETPSQVLGRIGGVSCGSP